MENGLKRRKKREKREKEREQLAKSTFLEYEL
jgi:hypothetical protein